MKKGWRDWFEYFLILVLAAVLVAGTAIILGSMAGGL